MCVIASYLHDIADSGAQVNVLVGPEPRALLCDYGLSRMIAPDGVTSGMTTTGTPMSIRYASPELLDDTRQNMTSDIWAWGCLFVKARHTWYQISVHMLSSSVRFSWTLTPIARIPIILA